MPDRITSFSGVLDSPSAWYLVTEKPLPRDSRVVSTSVRLRSVEDAQHILRTIREGTLRPRRGVNVWCERRSVTARQTPGLAPTMMTARYGQW